MKKITEEQIEEIKRINREKLDYILSQGPEYVIELAIKYYGEGWMQVFEGEEHYLQTERMRYNAKNGALVGAKTNRNRRVNQINKTTKEVIREWENVNVITSELGLKKTQEQTLIGVLRGRMDSYMGYEWRFADEPKIIIYGEESNG